MHSKQIDIFFDVNDAKTLQNRNLMEGTRISKFSMPYRGTDPSLKEKKKDSDQHFTEKLFLVHQNDIRLTETFEQNSAAQTLNLPDFQILFPETQKRNFVNDQNLDKI